MEDNEWTYPFDKPHSWDWRDEQWYIRYLELKAYKKIYGDCKVPKNWAKNKTLATWVSTQRRNKNKMVSWRAELLNKLKFIWFVKNTLSRPWETYYEDLQKFKAEFGHCRVPRPYKVNGSGALHNWVSAQRRKYKLGKLSEEKISLLDELDFCWDFMEWSWQQKINLFLEYTCTQGYIEIAPDDQKNASLKNWIDFLRKNKYKLSADRIAQLNDIGFPWKERKDISPLYDHLPELKAAWMTKFDRLKAYQKEFGHCNVSVRDQNWLGLGQWVIKQRIKFKSNSLAEEYIELLNSIAFEWSRKGKKVEVKVEKYEQLWVEKYEQLKTYQKEYGHCNVQRRCEHTKKLAYWVHWQRARYKAGKISPDQIALLDEINFEWSREGKKSDMDVYEQQWMKKFEELKEFRTAHGHCNVQAKDERTKKLSQWVIWNRMKYRKNTLSQKQIDLLNSLDFEWSRKGKTTDIGARQERWDEKFEELKVFQVAHGHCNVQVKDEQTKNLIGWIGWQRKNYKNNVLSVRRIDLLNSIGFEWSREGKRAVNTRIKQVWERNFEELKQFKAQHGHCNVSRAQLKKLGRWVSFQRERLQKGTLPQDRIDLLNSLGFVWEPKKNTKTS